MFEQTFVNTHARTSKPWTVGLSLAAQAAAVGVAFLVPLLHTAVLEPRTAIPVYMPLRNMRAETPKTTTVARAASTRPVFVEPASFHAPPRIPQSIVMTPDAPAIAAAGPVPGAIPGIGDGADPLGILPQNVIIEKPAPVKPPPPAKKPVPAAPITVGTGVQAAKLFFGPKPAYPQLARAARVQGVVKLRAIIAQDGVIRNLQVMSGPPLLVNAAMQAVQQWRYRPTLLNGEPVEVITEIDVNFSLNQ